MLPIYHWRESHKGPRRTESRDPRLLSVQRVRVFVQRPRSRGRNRCWSPSGKGYSGADRRSAQQRSSQIEDHHLLHDQACAEAISSTSCEHRSTSGSQTCDRYPIRHMSQRPRPSRFDLSRVARRECFVCGLIPFQLSRCGQKRCQLSRCLVLPRTKGERGSVENLGHYSTDPTEGLFHRRDSKRWKPWLQDVACSPIHGRESYLG